MDGASGSFDALAFFVVDTPIGPVVVDPTLIESCFSQECLLQPTAVLSCYSLALCLRLPDSKLFRDETVLDDLIDVLFLPKWTLAIYV